MSAEENLKLMKTLDDSWNSQDLTVFRKRHAKDCIDCIVRWPNQPPTHGIEAHEQEALSFFKTFPDQHLGNNPYKTMIAQGDWTYTIAEFTETMKGPMTMADGTTYDVAVIVGSLRKDSINRKVADAIAELVPASLNAQCPSRDCGNVMVNRSCRN